MWIHVVEFVFVMLRVFLLEEVVLEFRAATCDGSKFFALVLEYFVGFFKWFFDIFVFFIHIIICRSSVKYKTKYKILLSQLNSVITLIPYWLKLVIIKIIFQLNSWFLAVVELVHFSEDLHVTWFLLWEGLVFGYKFSYLRILDLFFEFVHTPP
jgi:hypothetical protein